MVGKEVYTMSDLKNMDLDAQRIDSLITAEPPDNTSNDGGTGGIIDADKGEPVSLSGGKSLSGTLEIEGDDTYYAFYIQKKTAKTWVLTTRDVYDMSDKDDKQRAIVAVLRSFNNGRLEGYGKTHLLTRLMTNLSTMVYLSAQSNAIDTLFVMTCEYEQEATGAFINFTATKGGGVYLKLAMAYEGFKLDLDVYDRKMPFRIPKLEPVQDNKSKAAVVANLGIKTAATLFRTMGDRLNWYKRKRYELIDSKEKFERMMLSFLTTVQNAADNNKAVLVGLDTETTGLHMYDLTIDNPLRDSVVAIPFSWEDDTGFLICTDMYYFSNIESEDVYPLFTTLFRRNPDFTFPDIELAYCGKSFKFSRMNIVVSGWNVMFDERAFFSEGADIFFDEDGRQIYFNLNTDLVQGAVGQELYGSYKISNSLKAQTRRMIGDETLELEELFGKGNEDKYRYLQDSELALIYGGADADYTRVCVRKGRALLQKVLYGQYRKYDMTIMYMLAKAAWKGMPIDTSAVKKQGDLVYQDLERLKEFIYHYAWVANRDSLISKADRLKELLGATEIADVEIALEKDKMFKYPFTPANHKKLLFGMLGYPVIKRAEKTGEPGLDKFVLEKLMNVKRDKPVEVLLEDLMSVSDPTMKLVDKTLFNKEAYPLARVFSTYATLNKEYTSYYRPIMDNDMEERMFYDFTMARAATRRILSPGQTMKGTLKSLVVAPKGKLFMSFDASQIEYRHMASLAYIRYKGILKAKYPDDWEKRLEESAIAAIFNMMQKEEADYHIETAALLTGVKQYEVTPKVRKRYKSIGFGIPYGLGERRLCENLFGGEVNDANMRETKELLEHYKSRQKEIIDLLESARDSAFVPTNISDEYRKYLGVGDSHVGIVKNFVGFYRVFILENLTRQRVGRIRRQAGNCIIQGGAAELFRRMLYNFHIGCCKYGIQDKVQWVMTVHDELDAVIDADIDVLLLIKVLYENCTLRYEDHIPYYIGIGFGPSWEDAKSDDKELPVIMVKRMISAYDAGKFFIPCDGNQAMHLFKLKRHYMCDRIEEEIRKILPNIGKGYVWTEENINKVDSNFENYVVRAYLNVFGTGSLKEQLEAWQQVREEYGFQNSFLNTKFVSDDEGQDILLDFDTSGDLDFSLNLELLNDDTDNVELDTEGLGNWFDENSMFDQSVPLSELLVDNETESYRVLNSKEEDDLFVENENPTNAFDIFVSTKYIRTKVMQMQEGMYSVLLHGNKFNGREKELCVMIKQKFSPGTSTLVIIGRNILKIANLSCTEDELEWLDKLILAK